MRTREVIIGDRIFLEIVYEAPEKRRRPHGSSSEDEEDDQRGRVRIGELVPDSWQM